MIRLRVGGASAARAPEAERPLAGRVNYVIGADPSQWRLDVRTYGRVRYKNAYPGIDLVYYGTEGRLEYDSRVAPGASPGVVHLAFDGADGLRVDQAGTLHVSAHGHELSFEKPVAYQTIAGVRKSVAARYHLDGTTIGFDVGAYDAAAMLVIDPVLSYLTYLGGSNTDVIGAVPPQVAGPTGKAAVLDSASNLYLAGYTQSSDFPTQSPFAAMPTKTAGSTWAFVTKLAPDAKSLIFSTYLGGTLSNDYGYAIALDSTGNAFVVGMTTSNDFPVTSGAYQTLCSPNYINSPNNPVASCSNNGGSAAFVTKLGPTGALLASTFLSGSVTNAFARAVAVDASGRPYVVGTTVPGENIPTGIGGFNQAIGFPVTAGAIVGPYNYIPNVVQNGALQNDAFLSVFDPTLKTLVYSTLIGDTQAAGVLSNHAETKGTGVAVDASGNFYVVGTTQDSYLPTTAGVVQGALSSCGLMVPNTTALNGVCGFAAKFTPVGQASAPSPIYLTYLGGSPTGRIAFSNQVAGVAVDAAGDAYIAGFDNSAGFPTTAGAYQTTCDGYNAATNTGSSSCAAAFIAKPNPTGATLLASTYYGCVTCSGDAVYTAGSILLDASSNVYIAGIAGNSVATAGGFSSNNGGDASPFVAEFDAGLTTLRFGTLLNVGGAGQVSTGGLALGGGNSIYLAGNVNSPTTSTATATARAFQAAYGGGSSDGFVAKIIVTATTKTTLSVTPGSSIGGTAVTFTATVVAFPGSGVPTGNVTFNNGTTALGTGTLNASGVASFTSSTLAAGTYAVTAAYAGDAGNNPSTSTAVTETVTAATTTTLSAAPTSAAIGASVTFTATVAESPGGAVPTGSVTFASGATMLGTGTLNAAGVAAYTTSSLAAGAYSVTVVYGGDTLNNPSTSSAVAVTITPPLPTVTVSVAPTSITVGDTATISWSSTNATACTASGSWSGSEATSGSQSVTPSASGTLTYGVSCNGGGGSGSGSATLTVNAKPSGGGHGGGGAFDASALAALAAIALARRCRRGRGVATRR